MAAVGSGQWVLPFLLLLLFELVCMVRGNVSFEVQHKYGGYSRVKVPLRELRAHDSRRHGRSLADVEFEVGGDGSPTEAALYFAKITIGTPPVDYHVQIDTGSDILWVNCKDCENCPTKSHLKIDLQQYDLKASSTAKAITCDQDFCQASFQGNPIENCKVGANCEYSISYGDGSTTQGFFVRDSFTFNQVTGNNQTSTMNESIAFGCSNKQSRDPSSSSLAVDGIIGFGQANTSIVSQLALAGKVNKIFSHCFDGKKGGGIFAIGEVLQPKFNVTPLGKNQLNYNAELESIEVGTVKLKLPWDVLGSSPSKTAIIDSGTTLSYLPSDIYKQVTEQMFSHQPNLKLHLLQDQFQCFSFSGNVDDGFPIVKFLFQNSLNLPVYPHEYLFEVNDGEYCIGWQNRGIQGTDGQEMTLLGDLALSDKLVVYNLENQTVGWTEHDCSTSINVKDDESGNTYDVKAKNLSDSPVLTANVASILLLIAAVLHLLE